jgi:DNA-binding NarL/FixJ family response regulator
VLIVDDHEGFRESARALLEAEGFAVVGDAADGAGAIAEVARLRPEVVLLDVQLPDVDGFAVAGRLAAGADPPRVVLISSREAAAYGPRLGTAPVCGFLAKRELSGAALAALVR